MKIRRSSNIRGIAARVLPLLSLATALCFGASLLARAQATGGGQQNDKSVPPSQVDRKNRAPVSKDLIKVKFPRPLETKLPNGITVLILEDHRLPTINVSTYIAGAGGLYEPEDQRGLATITAAMLREGTKTRSSKQFAEDSDKLGANINAATGFNSGATNVGASGLSQNFDDWFALYT